MTTLDYGKHRERDSLITILEVVAIGLIPCVGIADIIFGPLHGGLRGGGEILTRDVVATVGICTVPLVGILVSSAIVWQCRRRRMAGTLVGATLAVMHAWTLYAFGSSEAVFWSMIRP
jgi:hypothetical protein